MGGGLRLGYGLPSPVFQYPEGAPGYLHGRSGACSVQTMSYQPPHYRFLPPWLWNVLMGILVLGIALRLVKWAWNSLAG